MAEPVTTTGIILTAVAGSTAVEGIKGSITGIINDSGALFQKVFITVLVLIIDILEKDSELLRRVEIDLEHNTDKIKQELLNRIKNMISNNKKLIPDFDSEEEMSTILYLIRHVNPENLVIAVKVTLVLYIPAVIILTPYFAVKGAVKGITKFWTDLDLF